MGTARLVQPAGTVVPPRLLELEQLEVHPEALQVDDADARDGNARDALDEPVRLDLPVGDELEPEEVAVEGQRAVGIRARDREMVDADDHLRR